MAAERGQDDGALVKAKSIVKFLDTGVYHARKLSCVFLLRHLLAPYAQPRFSTDGNGFMDTSEVKVLISKLAGISVDEIPDDHPDVQMLSNITADELSQRLWKSTDPELLEAYFKALGLDEALPHSS